MEEIGLLIVFSKDKWHADMLTKNYNEIIIKCLSIIALILAIFSLCVIAKSPGVNGYEISIYGAYPSYFWGLLIVVIACGISILVHQAFTLERSPWWVIGIFLVIFTNLIIILLPLFRGYFISSLADESTHLGMIKDIYITNHIGSRNYYPISHLFVYNLSSICALDPRLLIKIIPSIFYLLYLLGIYLICKQICEKFGQILLVMAFGSVLQFTYFNYLFFPTQLFLFLVPLIIFLFLRKIYTNSINFSLILILMILPMPFFHPLGSLFLIAIFLIISYSFEISNILTERNIKGIEFALHIKNKVPNASLIIFIIFFSWFWNFARFRHTVIRAYQWFSYDSGTVPVDTIEEMMVTANFTIIQFIDLLIKNYGHILISILLSIIAMSFILRKAFLLKKCLRAEEIYLPLLFSAFSIFYILTLFGSFINTGYSLRIFCWALMISTVLNGNTLYEWLSKFNDMHKSIVYISLAVVIIISSIIGIFSVYPSPYIKQAGFQATTMDYSGMEWFLNYKIIDDTMYFDQLPFRAPDYIYGRDLPRPKNVGHFYNTLQNIGYNENESLSCSVNSDSYIVISERVRVKKEQLWPDIGRYTIKELYRINWDSSVDKMFSNGGLDVYHVFASKNVTC